MDNSVSSWFSELEMEDPLFQYDQCDFMDHLDDELSAALEEDLSPRKGDTFSPILVPRNSSSTTLMSAISANEARPAKQPRSNNGSNSPSSAAAAAATAAQQNMPNTFNLPPPSSSSPMILTFGSPIIQSEINHSQQVGNLSPEDDAVSEVFTSHGSFVNLEDATKTTTKPKKTGGRVRPPSQTYDHIIAERKRREQLSQRFVALSAIVPGLKKMDKTSVLGDAINYLKHLQERVKTLEEQTAKQTKESVVLVKRSQVFLEDEGSSDEMGGGPDEQQTLPEIEAKVCNKNILLRVHCENHKGVLVQILSEIEKLNLDVISTSVAPFGSLALDISHSRDGGGIQPDNAGAFKKPPKGSPASPTGRLSMQELVAEGKKNHVPYL